MEPIILHGPLSQNPQIRVHQLQGLINKLQEILEANKYSNMQKYSSSHLEKSIAFWKADLKQTKKQVLAIELGCQTDMFREY